MNETMSTLQIYKKSITPGKCILLTNHRKNIIGFGGKDQLRYRDELFLLFCGSFSIAQDTSYMHQVDSLEEYHEILNNIHRDINESKDNVQELLDKIKVCEEDITNISSLDVLKTNNSALYYKEQLKRESNIIEDGYSISTSFSDLVVKDNKILIPDRSEPFYYNTDVDLLQFEIGDILEIGFQDHPKAGKRYRGKTFQFVVNNFYEYKYRNKTRRLALTPITEGWVKKDIIILDDSDRFECLMEDLFPCNRRPFAGWQKKNLSVKKIGAIPTLPKMKNAVDLENLLNVNPDDYILSYDYHDNSIQNVYIKKNAKGIFWTCKIVTSSDVKRAIEILRSKILDYEKSISDAKEYQTNRGHMLTACSELEYERFFDDIPYVEEDPEIISVTPPKPVVETPTKEICVEKDNKGYYGVEYVHQVTQSGTIEYVATYSDKRRFHSDVEAYERFSVVLQHVEKLDIHRT